jgi:outer membrane immunogenic protein
MTFKANDHVRLKSGGAEMIVATPSAVELGGYLGCDYQFASPVVVGIEGDAEWANIRGGSVDFPNTAIPALGVPADTYETQANFEASVRGRLGYAFQNWLFYATGGVGADQGDLH